MAVTIGGYLFPSNRRIIINLFPNSYKEHVPVSLLIFFITLAHAAFQMLLVNKHCRLYPLYPTISINHIPIDQSLPRFPWTFHVLLSFPRWWPKLELSKLRQHPNQLQIPWNPHILDIFLGKIHHVLPFSMGFSNGFGGGHKKTGHQPSTDRQDPHTAGCSKRFSGHSPSFRWQPPAVLRCWGKPKMIQRRASLVGKAMESLWVIPSGYVKIAIENGHRNSGFTH